jgi:putative NADH-flavin reductase
MKIAVFGSTGKTGIEVVKQALELGHSVRAFVRDPNKMTIKNANLTLAQGDVLDFDAVEKAVKKVEAVVVALGAGPDTKGPMMTNGTKNIVGAMKKHNVKRLVVEGSYPMSGSPESMKYLMAAMPKDQIAELKPLIDDKAGQEKVTLASGLDWTVVRPLGLTSGRKTGKYRTGEKLDVKPGDKISRADVAEFMLKCLETREWVRKIATLSY